MKKIFNILLAFMLLTVTSPINVLAEEVEEPNTEETQEENKEENKEEQPEEVPVDEDAQGELPVNNDQSVEDKEIIKVPMETPSSVTGEKYNGSGTVVDFTTTASKAFYTVQTPDNSLYYIVIDLDKTENNVYFLSEVNGEELEMSQVNQSQTNQPAPETDTETEPAPEAEPEIQSEQSQFESTQGTNWTLWIIILGAAALFGYQFFYGKLKNLNPLLNKKKEKNKVNKDDKDNKDGSLDSDDENIYLEQDTYLSEEDEDENQLH